MKIEHPPVKPLPVQPTIGSTPHGTIVRLGSGTICMIVDKRFGEPQARKFAVNLEHGNVYSDYEGTKVTVLNGKLVLED